MSKRLTTLLALSLKRTFCRADMATACPQLRHKLGPGFRVVGLQKNMPVLHGRP